MRKIRTRRIEKETKSSWALLVFILVALVIGLIINQNQKVFINKAATPSPTGADILFCDNLTDGYYCALRLTGCVFGDVQISNIGRKKVVCEATGAGTSRKCCQTKYPLVKKIFPSKSPNCLDLKKQYGTYCRNSNGCKSYEKVYAASCVGWQTCCGKM